MLPLYRLCASDPDSLLCLQLAAEHERAMLMKIRQSQGIIETNEDRQRDKERKRVADRSVHAWHLANVHVDDTTGQQHLESVVVDDDVVVVPSTERDGTTTERCQMSASHAE